MITKANTGVKDLPRLGIEPWSPDPQPVNKAMRCCGLYDVYYILKDEAKDQIFEDYFGKSWQAFFKLFKLFI